MDMLSFVRTTFGGLSRAYYFRHLIFAIVISAFLSPALPGALDAGNYLFIVNMVISTFLYPYARFVYESIVSFIMGDNVIIVNIIIMMLLKILMMLVCYFFAIFIAPIGLIYLFLHHNKKSQ